MSLLVVGSVAFDAIETPFGKTDKIIGGAATYISLASSYYYDNVNLVAVVGGDFPKEDITLLEKHGVNTDGLQIKEDEKSFFWSGKYHNNMNERDTLVTELNVLENFDPILPASYQDCEYLMLGNLAPQVQKMVIERLEKRPKLIVMDTMNFWMDIALEPLKETIAMVDLLSINDEEARQLSGEYSLLVAAEKIMAMGPKYLIIKKGENGALLFGEGEVFWVPALLLKEVCDPTGAGDTFAGGLIGYVAKKGEVNFATIKEALMHGTTLASLTVEKFGTERLVDLDPKLIDQRLEELTKLSQHVI